MNPVLALQLAPAIGIIGLFTGLAYGALAIGLVLVYRATRVINFAHAELGALGGAVLALLVLDHGWNWVAAVVVVVAGGVVLGGLTDIAIVRRLSRSSPLAVLVGTIGLAELFYVVQLSLPDVRHPGPYPSPLHRTLHLAGITLRSEHFLALALIPAAAIGLGMFLNRTAYGVGIRAVADNADAARLAGIPERRVHTFVWALAGGLAVLAVVLINPLRSVLVGLPGPPPGPGLLERALAAALIGRMTSVPAAVAGGVGLGVLEAYVLANVGDPGVADAVIFLVVLVLLFVQARRLGATDPGGWDIAGRVRSAGERMNAMVKPSTRLRRGSMAAGIAVAVLLPFVFSQPSQMYLMSRVAIFVLIGLSVTVLTGWAGQLSLGQFAFVGLGAFGAASLVSRGMPFSVALAYATVLGAGAALLIGLPALRIRGPYLAVATLAYGVAARQWLFTRHTFVGQTGTAVIPRAHLFGLNLASQRTYYFLCLVVALAVIPMVSRLRRTGNGRRLIAVRENENNAAAFTISPTLAKLSAFALAGALAALAGGLLGGLRVEFGPEQFGADQSLLVVAMAVIGGLGSVTGAVLGALYLIGLPSLIGETPVVTLLTSSVGLLVLLLFAPGGLLQVVTGVATRLRGLGASGEPPAADDAEPGTAGAALERPPRMAERVLTVEGATVRFGGVVAVDAVDLVVGEGEVVGLMGANGAGKTTLMNAVSGFQALASGDVRLGPDSLAAVPPYERARMGLGRQFQDGRLFSNLTARECVLGALEAEAPSDLVPSLLALPSSRRGESDKREEADEILSYLKLSDYAEHVVAELSTGTRRVLELACLMALRPSVLLLDEPTSGIAQREVEAYGKVIKRLQDATGAGILLIEHDIPLLMDLCDRVYCLDNGRVIAEGPPETVRRDPAVVAAYLGTTDRGATSFTS
jgi:ABC-type branched-subunit amino acid transport system ATPase component/ABC-type branched-subunit amino acid transport system permease subunit